MVKPIFSVKDFHLCDVPVPKGYPKSQTHAGVTCVDDCCILTSSPYPSASYPLFIRYFRSLVRHVSFGACFGTRRAECYENPMLYIGNFCDENPPCVFTPYVGNPIVSPPPRLFGFPSFNSDPDVFAKDGTIYILNREVFRTYVGEVMRYWMRLDLIKGHLDDRRFKYTSFEVINEGDSLLASPSLTHFNGEFKLFYLLSNSYNDGSPCDRLVLCGAKDVKDLFNNQRDVRLFKGGVEPWHMSVFQHNGKLYAIVAGVPTGQKQICYQMLGVFSPDLDSLKIFSRPLISAPSYRGGAFVRDIDNMFVMYSTTVHYGINGSSSVDGRDIIMVKKPFDKLLSELEYNE